MTDTDKIEICEHVKIWFKEFYLLHTKIRILLKSDFKNNKVILNNTFKKFSQETSFNLGKEQKLLGIYSDDDINFSYIFTNNQLNEINELIRINSHLSNIDVRFACNAAYNQLQILKN